jgi:hypothetical protein
MKGQTSRRNVYNAHGMFCASEIDELVKGNRYRNNGVGSLN